MYVTYVFCEPMIPKGSTTVVCRPFCLLPFSRLSQKYAPINVTGGGETKEEEELVEEREKPKEEELSPEKRGGGKEPEDTSPRQMGGIYCTTCTEREGEKERGEGKNDDLIEERSGRALWLL